MRALGAALALVVGLLASPNSALSHGGGLDGLGCHHNRKAGGYHCHRGPLAGKAFESKEKALEEFERLQKQEGETKKH